MSEVVRLYRYKRLLGVLSEETIEVAHPSLALVTADRDEAAKTENCGALIISPQEFAVLIS